jgi:hypothetical protein
MLSKNLKIKIYRNVIFPVVLYGCDTWSEILRKKLRLRVFENRVLRGIFGPKTDEVTGVWPEFHDLNSSFTIVQVIKSRRMG